MDSEDLHSYKMFCQEVNYPFEEKITKSLSTSFNEPSTFFPIKKHFGQLQFLFCYISYLELWPQWRLSGLCHCLVYLLSNHCWCFWAYNFGNSFPVIDSRCPHLQWWSSCCFCQPSCCCCCSYYC